MKDYCELKHRVGCKIPLTSEKADKLETRDKGQKINGIKVAKEANSETTLEEMTPPAAIPVGQKSTLTAWGIWKRRSVTRLSDQSGPSSAQPTGLNAALTVCNAKECWTD